MSTQSHDERKQKLLREIEEAARVYFNGPYIYPESRESIGRRLRELLLDSERLDAFAP